MRIWMHGVVVLACLWVSVVADAEEPTEARKDDGVTLGQLDYDARLYGRMDANRSRSGLLMAKQTLSSEVDLWSRGDESVGLSVDVGHLWLDGDVRLGRFGAVLPEHLYDVQIGGQYRRTLANDRRLAATLTLGSPSDRPFDSLDEVSVGATASVTVPQDAVSDWIFSVAYSNMQSFMRGIPIPGVAYRTEPNDRLTLLLGVPVTSARWAFADRWAIRARYMVPRSIQTRLEYTPVEALMVYTGFAWDHECYLRHDRRDTDDRLFYYDKRAEAGVEIAVAEQVSLNLVGGWAFDRFFFEGEDYGDRGQGRIDVGDGPYGQVAVRWRF